MLFNLFVSNVPGPQLPLYIAGARVEGIYPVSAVTDITGGLNITLFSYDGSLDFGLIACREMVPDVWNLIGYLEDAMAEMVALVPVAPSPRAKPAAEGRGEAAACAGRPSSGRPSRRPRKRSPVKKAGRQEGHREEARSAIRLIASTNVSCSCSGRSWPIPGTSSSSEPGIAREVARPPETCTILSAVPWITSVGTVTSRSRAVRSGWDRIATICRATPAALTPRSQVSAARSRTACSVSG